jgi:hypothetical protein
MVQFSGVGSIRIRRLIDITPSWRTPGRCAKRPINYVDATTLVPQERQYSSMFRWKSASTAISAAIASYPRTSCAAWLPN